jgi:flagellar motor switch protein FliG
MNGIKKAALFLSGLDYTKADQLLSRLDAESARLIRREMGRNLNVSAEESQQLDEEFLHTAGWQPTWSRREHQFATPKPATYSSKRPAVRYTAEAFVPPVRSFDFMRNWSVNDVASAIMDEHPQTIAVVLSHLPQSKMKSVLSVLPSALQREIKQRLDEFEMPEESIVQEIESALKVRYRQQRRPVNHSVMLDSFDDLVTLSDKELSTLFHSVDLTTAMLALIGADPVLIARTTKHFSPTEEHHMHKRLKQMRSIDDEDIEQARCLILEQYNATAR